MTYALLALLLILLCALMLHLCVAKKFHVVHEESQ